MKVTCDVTTNLRIKEVQQTVKDATIKALKDVAVDIAHDVVEGSPVLTGNNRRSIKWETKEFEASIYSTSGYGGFLETGTVKMGARPYFRPALDKNMPKLPEGIKANIEAS